MIFILKNKIKDVLRISIHHYNKYNEIDYLIKCLIDLIKKSNDIDMNVERFIRFIQITAVLLILAGAIIGFLSEVNLMIEKMKVELADLLLFLFMLKLWE